MSVAPKETAKSSLAAMMSIEEIRRCFPALARTHLGHPVAYFDGPGGTQVPRAVVEAMNDYLYHHNANTHWAYPTSAETDVIIDSARSVLADFLNAGPTEIVFGANMITGCHTYGASAWNVTLVNTVQHNLVITKEGEPVVTVDDLEVGQFIYLILNNTKIRNVINTITSKGVLILGRFSDPQRKSVLDGLREALRSFGLLPIVFDFDCPTDKDYTETVQTLAGMSM